MAHTDTSIATVLENVGALISNTHVVYTSGSHGSIYFNKDAIYAHPNEISKLCEDIAEHFTHENIEVVIAPALGGIILSQWTAHHLSRLTGKEILAAYAEKTSDGKNFVIKRGYDTLIKGKRILLVEDVLNTGGSIKKVVDLCKTLGARIVGLGALCNYDPLSTLKAVIGVPKIYSLYPAVRSRWPEADCLLCKSNTPINTTVGKGLEFLARASNAPFK